MKDLRLSEIKTTYYYGGKTMLTESWKEFDVVLPTSKLYFVIDGEIVVNVNGVEHVLKKGDAALIPQGVKHSFYLTKKLYGCKYWFHFDISQGHDFFLSINFKYVTHISEYEKMYNLFENIGKSIGCGDIPSKLSINGDVCSIVALYLKYANAHKIFDELDEIDGTIQLIEDNLSTSYTLEYLSETAHLSPNYYVRKFKEKTGLSPIKYATFIKINKAKTLLEQTDKNITEIMRELGFCDSAYFSKLFKSHTGCSPRRFREIYGNDSSEFEY